MSEIARDANGEPLSPSLNRSTNGSRSPSWSLPAPPVVPAPLAAPTDGFEIDGIWEAVYKGDTTNASFTTQDWTKLVGTLMRRLAHCEEQRKIDRLISNERWKQLQHTSDELKQRVIALETQLASASDYVLKYGLVPHFDPSPEWNPRTMTVHEEEWLRARINNVPNKDERNVIIARIIGKVPDSNGFFEIDFSVLTPNVKWQLYYYLRHRKIVRKRTPSTKRGDMIQGTIDNIPLTVSVKASVGGTSSGTDTPSQMGMDDDNDDGGVVGMFGSDDE